MTDKLKSCPFCGRQEYARLSDDENGYYVVCDASGMDSNPNRGCGSQAGYQYTDTQAVNAWNRRDLLQEQA